MAIGRKKVVLVGAGSVGAAVAFDVVMKQVCEDLILIDRNKEKAWAEATDLQHSLGYSESKMIVRDGEYEDCKDADIVVISAAPPFIVGQKRPDMLGKASAIIRDVVSPIMASGFSGIFIVITNPVDVITRYVQKLSGLPAGRVIGTGTALDSARLKYHLAEVMNVDPQSVYALCMGEHGDSQMIPWSQVTVGGKNFLDILKDNPDRLKGVETGAVGETIKEIAYRVANAKGATTFGIAATTVQIMKAVLFDENKVIPVSAMLNGEYGETGIYAGVPAVLNHQGVKELVEFHLPENERNELKNTFAVIRQFGAELGL